MSDTKLRNFHEAQWDEDLIFEQSVPGSRSLLVPDVSKEAGAVTGALSGLMPAGLKRKEKPALPELAQPQVLRHYLRLSQETIGQDINIDIGLGTCTMKYSPKINEQFVRSPKFTEMHPYQDDDTAQGILKIIYDFEQIMKEISGLDAVSFQPGGGGQQAVVGDSRIAGAEHGGDASHAGHTREHGMAALQLAEMGWTGHKVGRAGQGHRTAVSRGEPPGEGLAVLQGQGAVAVYAARIRMHAIDASGLCMVAAQDRDVHALQDLPYGGGAQAGYAHADRVEHDRDAHTTGLFARAQHRVQLAGGGLPNVEHECLRVCGHLGGLLRRFGHDGRCADGKRGVGAVVDGNAICDAVNDRAALAQRIRQQACLIYKLHGKNPPPVFASYIIAAGLHSVNCGRARSPKQENPAAFRPDSSGNLTIDSGCPKPIA